MKPSADGTIPLIEELAKLPEDYFGDDPEAVNFLRSLKKVHTNYPSMLLESAFDRTIIDKNGRKQTFKGSYSNYMFDALSNKQG